MSSPPPPGEKEAGLKTSAAIEARLQSDVNCAGDWLGDGKWEVLEKQSEIGGRREPRSRRSLREGRESPQEFGGVFSNEANAQSINNVMKEDKCLHWHQDVW